MTSQCKDYDFVGSYDNQRISTINAERSVNLFEYLDPNGKRPKALISTSGLVDSGLDFSPETGGSRGTFVFKNTIYQVFGATLFGITGALGSLVSSPLGTLVTTVGYVGIDANQYQVIFVDGTEGYIWDTNATTFAQITDSGFPTNPLDVCYLDGYFLVISGGTNTFYLSLINNGMVWSGGSATFTANSGTDILTLSTSNANFQTGVPVTFTTTGTLPAPLNTTTTYYVIMVGTPATNPGTIKLATSYANAIAGTAIDITTNGAPTNTITVSGQLQFGSITSHPGTLVACRTLHRRIFLFSQFYTEVWENAGVGTNLPFRRNNSLLMEVGTPAIGSVAVGFDRMCFLAQDRDGLAGVMGVSGSEAVPVSNRALDYQLAQYVATTGVSDARGIFIKENGLIFYRLNFTTSNHTFVFNISMSAPDTPRWHEEEVLNGDRHPAQTHAYFAGVNFYGNYQEALFYLVSDQVTTNNGERIRRMRIGRQMTPDGYKRLRIDRWHLDLLQGALSTANSGFTSTHGLNNILTTPYAPNAQPVVYLSVSKDGGQSYGNNLHSTMGKIGERTHRTVWRKIGTTPRGQGYVPKVEFFSEIPFVVLGAAWNFEVLPE